MASVSAAVIVPSLRTATMMTGTRVDLPTSGSARLPACVLGALAGRKAELSLLTWLASEGRKCTDGDRPDEPDDDDEPAEPDAEASKAVKEGVHRSGVSVSGLGGIGLCTVTGPSTEARLVEPGAGG